MQNTITLDQALDVLRISLQFETDLQREKAFSQHDDCSREFEFNVFKGMASVLEDTQESLVSIDGDRCVTNVTGCINSEYLGDDVETAIIIADKHLSFLVKSECSEQQYPEILGQMNIWTRVAATLRTWEQ